MLETLDNRQNPALELTGKGNTNPLFKLNESANSIDTMKLTFKQIREAQEAIFQQFNHFPEVFYLRKEKKNTIITINQLDERGFYTMPRY